MDAATSAMAIGILKTVVDLIDILEQHGVSRENIDAAIDAEKKRKDTLMSLLKST